MRARTTVRQYTSVVVALAVFVICSPVAVAQTDVLPTPPTAGANGTPYVGDVGTYVSGEDLSAYLRAGPPAIQPAAVNPTPVSVGPSGDDSASTGTPARGNVVTGWDFVGLTFMALAGVGGVGLLMGRRRSF